MSSSDTQQTEIAQRCPTLSGRVFAPVMVIVNATAVAASICFGSVSYAQTTANSTNTLDTLVVTGTRSERRLFDVPVRTEVITRQELQRTHARDIADALQHQPGVLLRDIHGKSGTEVWLQGLDSDRVLVLIDGRPVSASTGSTVDLTQISATDVERIEIVKGAVSALYGSAAMGGVINVITRQNPEPRAGSVVLDSGSHGSRAIGSTAFGERHLAANAAARRGPVNIGIDLDVRDSDGFDLDEATYSFEGDRGSKLNLNGRVDIEVNPNERIRFVSAWYDEDIDRDFSTFAPGIGDIEKLDAETASRYTQSLDWKRDLGRGEALSAWVSVERFDDQTVQDIVATGELDQLREASIVTRRVDLQYDRPLGQSQVLTMGVTASDVTLEQSLERFDAGAVSVLDEISPGSEAGNVDVFLQNDIFIGDTWELLPGVRVQQDSDFGNHVAPKINALYQPAVFPNWNPRVRAGIGSGYRVPNLKERHFLFDHSALGYVVLGNDELLPEQSLSLQLGIELSNSGGTRSDLSLFHNRFTDLITTSRDSEASARENLEVFRYDNVDDARTYGSEINVARDIHPNLTVRGAWTWMEATDLGTNRDLTRRPRHQLQLAGDIALGRTDFSVLTTWQSSEFVDAQNLIESKSYASVALKLNRRFNQNLTGFAGIDNFTNEHRDPDRSGLDLRPKQGRFIYAGLRIDL